MIRWLIVLSGCLALFPVEGQVTQVAEMVRNYDGCHCRQAFVQLEAAARNGDVVAQRYAGIAYEDGLAIPASLAQALSWYKRAANLGDHTSAIKMASLYRRLGLEAEAKTLLQAERGGPQDADALYELAQMETKTGDTKPGDQALARQLYLTAAKEGNSAASRELALMLINGTGGPADAPTGLKLLKTAAENGNAQAALDMGHLAEDSDSGMEAGLLAPAWYELAAKLGREEGYLRAAEMFSHGRMRGMAGVGYSPNYKQVIDWYTRAAASRQQDVVLIARNQLLQIALARDREAKDANLSDLGETQLDSSGVTLANGLSQREPGVELCRGQDHPQARIASLRNNKRLAFGTMLDIGSFMTAGGEWTYAGWSYFQPGQCKWVKIGTDGAVDLAIQEKNRNGKWETAIDQAVRQSDSEAHDVFEEDCGTSEDNFIIFSEKRMGKRCLGPHIFYNLRIQNKVNTRFRLNF